MNQLTTLVAQVAGGIFLCVLIVRMVSAYAKNMYSEMVTNFLAGIVVAGFVYDPTGVMGMLKSAWTIFKTTIGLG